MTTEQAVNQCRAMIMCRWGPQENRGLRRCTKHAHGNGYCGYHQPDRSDPVCAFHGKRRSEHECLYCALCFKDLTRAECHVLPDGSLEDVCNPCAEYEARRIREQTGVAATGEAR